MDPQVHAKIFRDLDRKIGAFHVEQNLDTDPVRHIGVNLYLMKMRKELYYLGRMKVKARREKLYRLFLEDFLRQEKELREVDMAYIATY